MCLIAIAPVIIGLLAVSALFSAAETAMTGASRGRMHQLERDGDRAARRVNRLIADQETMIGSVLLGNNLINILASALVTEVLTKAIPGGWGVAAATALMTVLVLVFAEVLPKTLAITRSDDVARWLSVPTEVAIWLFGPSCSRCSSSSARRSGCSGSRSAWRTTSSPPTRRSGARWSTTTPKAWWKAATAACWAGCWTWRRWTSPR